jgi:hypothetical protein
MLMHILPRLNPVVVGYSVDYGKNALPHVNGMKVINDEIIV